MSLQLDGKAGLQCKPQPWEAQPSSELTQEQGQAWSPPGADSEHKCNPSNPESAWGGIHCGVLGTQDCDCGVLSSLASCFYMAFGLCCSSGTDFYKVSLLWEHTDCRYRQFQRDHTLLEKHKFMFWKGSLLLPSGRRCQGVLNEIYVVSHINEFKARLEANSNSLVSLSIWLQEQLN